MKQVFRRFLMVLWGIGVSLVVGGGALGLINNDMFAALVGLFFVVPAWLMQFIFLGYVNPLSLFDKE